MYFPRYTGRVFATLLLTASVSPIALAADEIVIEEEITIDASDSAPAEEILIDDTGSPAIESGDIVIDEPASEQSDTIVIDDSTPAESTETEMAESSNFDIGLDKARVEYGYVYPSDSEADNTFYGHLSGSANWQPDPSWEFQAAARVDGNGQSGGESNGTFAGDYGDTFVRFRGDTTRVTLGTQTVIWGRMDEIPLSDFVSTADLSRFVLDDLEDRRRSNPVLRLESFFGAGKLDVVWLFDFRPAELPDQDSIWYPINRDSGRMLGFDPDDIPAAAVRDAEISDEETEGDGGFGARYTRAHSFADIGVTVAHVRQSTPYYRMVAPGRFEAEYQRSWNYGIDAAFEAMGATVRVEAAYFSDMPVTRTDFSYTTTEAVLWGAGVEMHPGDGDTRVNVQVIGSNLVNAPDVLDRENVYSLNGEVDVPFDRGRWRASLDFNLGLNDTDVYLNPEIAFLGWEPHELYLAVHYFDGDDDTLGGFHEDHSSINLGWRSTF
ncbi:hypothetical protein [Thiosocius teredinicola]|uniref:hypothetical protein n=1 Tax=Thiosocius teredinicola TaxID=1973002 RepID=UPI000990C35D